MDLSERLDSRRAAIAERWTNLALEVYPEDSARFLRHERDRFRNPVGRITRDSLGVLLDGVLAGRPAKEARQALDAIVRIRAVQDLAPSQAVGFVFLLKRALREQLERAEGSDGDDGELARLDDEIDRLALRAFDLFMQCREQICDLRSNEIKRRTSRLLERLAESAGEQGDTGQHPKGGCGA